ncbi:MAG: hypothetical protein NT014_01925 [Candidatus Omnitrophica bacterium]|nr:hypothetical protein [Candidatus Omnitrophota bacterium]
MVEKARQCTPTTVKRLHTLSGNQCAAPDCTRPLIAKDGETIISKIAHIEAASEKGPRYNPNMTDDERRHFNNLILLCDEHHSIIDNMENESKYSVSMLKEWKRNHERKLLHNKLCTKNSLLKIAIDAISNIDFESSERRSDISIAFNIDDKISYNAIKRNKPLIDEYKIFHSKLNELYKELEIQGSFKKDKLLRNIKTIYLKIKGKYVGNSPDPIVLIKQNADNIIEDIEQELSELIEKDPKRYEEDITFGISIIMVDAFMRCKILEEPK